MPRRSPPPRSSSRSGGGLFPATVTYNSSTRTATLQPTSALMPSTVYTATVKGGASIRESRTPPATRWPPTWRGRSRRSYLIRRRPPSRRKPQPRRDGVARRPPSPRRSARRWIRDHQRHDRRIAHTRKRARRGIRDLQHGDAAATLLPSAALANSTAYTATVKGGATDPRVKDLRGNALATNVTWSFTTAAAPPPASSIWSRRRSRLAPIPTPARSRSGPSSAPTSPATSPGLRFYKFSSNTGTHTGHLWTRPARCSQR